MHFLQDVVSPKKAKSGRKKALVDEDEDDVARYEDDEEKEKEDEDRERDGEDGDKADKDGEKAAGDGEDAAEDEPVPETRIDVEVPKVSVEEVASIAFCSGENICHSVLF